MDILTKKGQLTLTDEKRAVQIFNYYYPDFEYIETPKNKPAIVDAFLIKDNELFAIVETKCRYKLETDYFLNNFDGKWLVTYEKIESARQISKNLGVQLVGFLYLKDSDSLLVATISDNNGLYSQKVTIEATETQKTINGGRIIRNNAYIDMNEAKVLKIGENNAP